MRQFSDGFSIAGKQAVWAWVFLAVPLLFFTAVRFWPTAQAVSLSFTSWNLLGPERFVGLDNYVRMASDAVFWKVIVNSFEYVAIGLPVSLRSVVRGRVFPRPRRCRAWAVAGAVFPAASDHGGGDGLGVALVLPAAAGGRVQHDPVRYRPAATAVPALDDAGAAGGAGAGDLGHARVPDRDLSGGAEGHPAFVTTRRRRSTAPAPGGCCSKSRCRCCARPSCSCSSSARSPSCGSSTTSTT